VSFSLILIKSCVIWNIVGLPIISQLFLFFCFLFINRTIYWCEGFWPLKDAFGSCFYAWFWCVMYRLPEHKVQSWFHVDTSLCVCVCVCVCEVPLLSFLFVIACLVFGWTPSGLVRTVAAPKYQCVAWLRRRRYCLSWYWDIFFYLQQIFSRNMNLSRISHLLWIWRTLSESLLWICYSINFPLISPGELWNNELCGPELVFKSWY
jgi:hypothetical protein